MLAGRVGVVGRGGGFLFLMLLYVLRGGDI